MKLHDFSKYFQGLQTLTSKTTLCSIQQLTRYSFHIHVVRSILVLMKVKFQYIESE